MKTKEEIGHKVSTKRMWYKTDKEIGLKYERETGNSNLTIKEWRIVVDVGDLDGEGANALQARLAGISGLDGDADELAVFALSVENFVGEDLACLLVDAELCPFLIRLLNDAVLDLSVDALVFVDGVNFDHRTAVRRSFLDLWGVRSAVFKDGFVIIDVGDEDDDNSRRSVKRRRVDRSSGTFNATFSVVGGSDVQLVLVAVQHDRSGDQTDDAGVLFDPEKAGCRWSADESESDSVAVFVRCHDRRYEGVRAGVLVDVRGVNLLRKFRRFVVLVLRVNSNCGCTGPRWLAWNYKFIILLKFWAFHLVLIILKLS